ncbi:DUF924 domain-containing protein [Alteromonas ponticola]|uniref:DUF924 domain-containing protein n=1 Tax=Alteromonas aquimaris TaxID=2998417 RepID=A0ABT3P7P6_9ALTE|nr:DUF924 family protein [Alteromonas aquimaris]MCW8108789.1 DUF924 domain-containing protein [Alteromonas aquimaris]
MVEKVSVSIEEASDVIAFWFDELGPQQWFKKDPNLDKLIASRYAHLHDAATRCELWPWRVTSEGRLAEIIVLDQFSRNIYRQSALAFANDSLALALSQEAISIGADKMLTIDQRAFLYMPFMHSESLPMHDIAMELFSINGLEMNLKFEKQHRDIIQRFGRYPHRNLILGRASTHDENAFLKQPDSAF